MAKKARSVKKRSTAAAGGKPHTVDDYIAGLDGWRQETVSALRDLVRNAAPDAEEAIKWAQPVYSENGPVCYMKAFANHVNFGFWRGGELTDPDGLLQGGGKKMAHVKITGKDDIPSSALEAFIQEAVRLNRLHGDPTKRQG